MFNWHSTSVSWTEFNTELNTICTVRDSTIQLTNRPTLVDLTVRLKLDWLFSLDNSTDSLTIRLAIQLYNSAYNSANNSAYNSALQFSLQFRFTIPLTIPHTIRTFSFTYNSALPFRLRFHLQFVLSISLTIRPYNSALPFRLRFRLQFVLSISLTIRPYNSALPFCLRFRLQFVLTISSDEFVLTNLTFGLTILVDQNGWNDPSVWAATLPWSKADVSCRGLRWQTLAESDARMGRVTRGKDSFWWFVFGR